MIIDCISDLHGQHPKLTGGDLLLIAGDYTPSDKIYQWALFFRWLKEQKYKKKIIVAGNHDNMMATGFPKCQQEADALKDLQELEEDCEYLCDSGTEYKGVKIWGSPWTSTFPGINPHCTAFTCESDDQLSDKWDLIPNDTDILITHSPPKGIFDQVMSRNGGIICTGSISLLQRVYDVSPKMHIFGHIHEHGGSRVEIGNTTFINCSVLNGQYKLKNKPVRFKYK